MNTSFKDTLLDWGVALSSKQEEQFESYLAGLKAANKQLNLTTIVKNEEILEKHFLDSLTILNIINKGVFKSSIKVLDIGAGGGLPGIPIKIIFPEIELVLVESVKKKATFLNKIIQDIGLGNTTCIADRAENLGNDASLRCKFDLVVARAVARINVLVEYMLPFLKDSGMAVIYKGGAVEGELQEAKQAIEILGGEVVDLKKFMLGDNKRSLVLIKKVKNTPDKYPRRSGMPKKRPL